MKSSSRSGNLAPNPRRADDDIIIPERVRIATVALPPKVHTSDLWLHGAPCPLSSIGVRDTRFHCETSNRGIVQPRLERAISAKMVFEARPCAGGKGLGGSDTLRRQVGQRSIVGLAVVHHDLGLAADAQVLVGALSGVGHGDKSDVGVCQGFGGFAGWM